MRLSIFKNPKFSEPEVILNYSEETDEVNKLIETLNSLNNTIQCFKNDSNFNIKLMIFITLKVLTKGHMYIQKTMCMNVKKSYTQ